MPLMKAFKSQFQNRKKKMKKHKDDLKNAQLKICRLTSAIEGYPLENIIYDIKKR